MTNEEETKKISEFIKNNNIPIVQVDENRGYWLVRTQSGEYHNEFYFDNFVAIDWNEFSDTKLFEKTEKETVVELIHKKYPDNKQPGLIYNQIKRFLYEMKIGDVVMIPSENTSHISFGIVDSEVYFDRVSDTAIDEGKCPFIKRRNVKWIKTVNRDKLDPNLYKMMNSRHTINNANDYAEFIDRTLYSFYVKGNKAHLILNIKKDGKIPAIGVARMVDSIVDLIPYLNEILPGSNFQEDDIEMKATFNSPGIIDLGGIFLLIMGAGMVLHYIVGGKYEAALKTDGKSIDTKLKGETDGLLEKILKFKKENPEKVKESSQNIDKQLKKVNADIPAELKGSQQTADYDNK
ncbi:hypothetical protein NOM01_10920 [Sporolactobacillus sp. STSJ-5]|uniref:hypothetical protein n=1 Tax=Sporolactobacillus sp. STSJ-5 TaxID=2965076 RepID=UPI002104AF90|nr:hypothetical protein [Sporolactobacillus sp. STSJ-5]MCQ2010527.1 hypothetical protein [Sporolactobacillus sp. STSJ-5]